MRLLGSEVKEDELATASSSGVECEDYANGITAERVRRVSSNGLCQSARYNSLKEGLGGDFTYCTLGEPIDAERNADGRRPAGVLGTAAYLLAHGVRVVGQWGRCKRRMTMACSTVTATTDYYLVYRPDIEWLRSNEAI